MKTTPALKTLQAVQLKHYHIEAELRRTTTFTFYRGRRRADETPVLVKVVEPLFAANDFLTWRFRQVARLAAGLEHPNILRADRAEQEGDFNYFVQEFPPAPTLAEIIVAEGPFSLTRTRYIAGQIASALDYAHRKGVIHSDLSAACVYLGPGDRVWVGEFGQTQALLGSDLARQGFDRVCVETLAPERVEGQGPSCPADLYALGILCYQMLAKRPPFTGPASAVLHAHTHKQPPSLQQLNPGVPLAVGRVIERMLAKELDLRYATALEFVQALTAASRTRADDWQYESLIPLALREHKPWLADRTFVYFTIALVMMLLVMSLSIWAGYELAAQEVARHPLPETQIVVIRPTPAPGDDRRREVLPPALERPTATPTALASLEESLPLELVAQAPSPTPTTTPTSAAFYRPPTETPPPPTPTSHEGRFVFYNPTGHDLAIDLTGPGSFTSAVIPPSGEHELLLEPGSYQCMVHTLTGQFLAPRTLLFDLAAGQVVKKDYYSDYDLTLR
jgi:serine/threonine-protein kinase